jgi:Protein of unknown function (DUF2924)
MTPRQSPAMLAGIEAAAAKAGGQDAKRGQRLETAEGLDVAIAALVNCDLEVLRLQWRNQMGGHAPAHLPRWLLLRLLAYRLQAAALGDLDKSVLRLLRQPRSDGSVEPDGRPFEARAPVTREGVDLQSGALLVREWNGKPERVMILDKGFAWNGGTYRSLSQIAKAMTGTNWNGHRFFGLRRSGDQHRAAATGEAERRHRQRPTTGRSSGVRRRTAGEGDPLIETARREP